jgi:hypothetical protein
MTDSKQMWVCIDCETVFTGRLCPKCYGAVSTSEVVGKLRDYRVIVTDGTLYATGVIDYGTDRIE